jgi:hypothetical protein
MTIKFYLFRLLVKMGVARSLLWAKNDDTYYFHIGSFTDGSRVAFKIVIGPFLFMIGYAKKKKENK